MIAPSSQNARKNTTMGTHSAHVPRAERGRAERVDLDVAV
jgi:hypothetical protein